MASRINNSKNDGRNPASTSSLRGRKEKRNIAMAKRGLRSLAMAVGLPLSLTFLTQGRWGGYYGETLWWFPPIWAVQMMSFLTTSVLMGLSGWLVWAEGGFHKNPATLYMYVAQLVLSLVWGPVVFRLGAPYLGLVICVGNLVALAGCCQRFKEINPIAADLVKPCLAWAAFLALVNLKLV